MTQPIVNVQRDVRRNEQCPCRRKIPLKFKCCCYAIKRGADESFDYGGGKNERPSRFVGHTTTPRGQRAFTIRGERA